MIDRSLDRALVQSALKRSRVVAILGPRQCGKTTLAREFLSADSLNYFDLEDPASLARLEAPDTALRPLKKLVVIDAREPREAAGEITQGVHPRQRIVARSSRHQRPERPRTPPEGRSVLGGVCSGGGSAEMKQRKSA